MSLVVDIEKKLDDYTLCARFETEGITGLLGASGSGKSMTLKCIAGIETPDCGRIELDGVTLFDSQAGINLTPQKRRVGYLFQNYALYPHMTVRQNILCGLQGVKDRAEQERQLAMALRRFRIEDVAERRPAQISGGQAQRVALARIMVNRPKMLLLDEPFSALDAHLRLQMQLEMKETLQAFSGHTLMVTHSREEAYHLCDTIAVMEQGVVGTVRDTRALFADPGSIAAARITGCKNIAAAKKISAHEVEVPAWGVVFTTAETVGDDVKAVGIRAHHLGDTVTENRKQVVFAGELEEPFAWVLLFRYADQPEASELLWWRISKDRRGAALPDALGIRPEDVMLLYESSRS